jgi:hypothetical protein
MAIAPDDIEVRNATYGHFIESGKAPSAADVAALLSRSEADVRAAWRRLHDAHALVLDGAGEIRMANPFSAVETPFRVEAAGKDWYANCAWDAFGIGAALHADSTIHTRCPDCRDPIRIKVRGGRPDDLGLVFHVLVPAVGWWRDIGFT